MIVDSPPPSFREAFQKHLASNRPADGGCRDKHRRIAKEFDCSHIADFALSNLRLRAGNCWRYLEASAVDGLVQQISARIRHVLAPALEVLCKGRLISGVDVATKRTCGVQEVDARRASRLIIRFPAAMETVTLLVWDWIDANRELLHRLDQDKKALRDLRHTGRSPFRVKWVQAGLSDYHNAGRSVVLLRFVNGDHVIYKPRGADGELLWFRILSWLNRERFELRFITPRIVGRRNYYWMDYFHRRSCRDPQDLKLFYQRWGAQAAIATIFRFADLHHENWIAAGPQPVLVDAETFGERDALRNKSQLDGAIGPLLRTGLLPFKPAEGVSYRGIAPFDKLGHFSRPPACWPRYRGKVLPPAKYNVEIIQGFGALLRFIAARGRATRAVRFSSMTERRLESRAIYRSTSEYARLLRQSLRPRQMLLRHSRLTELREKCSYPNGCSKITVAEAQALARCSIPRFTRPITRAEQRLFRSWPHDHFDRFEDFLARSLRF